MLTLNARNQENQSTYSSEVCLLDLEMDTFLVSDNDCGFCSCVFSVSACVLCVCVYMRLCVLPRILMSSSVVVHSVRKA